jgi:hypothetical protein
VCGSSTVLFVICRDCDCGLRHQLAAGIGDGAIEAHPETSSSVVMQAVQGVRIISIALVGKGATEIPDEQLRALMAKAFAR